jgi:hypothetical protein
MKIQVSLYRQNPVAGNLPKDSLQDFTSWPSS